MSDMISWHKFAQRRREQPVLIDIPSAKSLHSKIESRSEQNDNLILGQAPSAMTKTQVEVITSVQRRRRWSRAEKERLVTAALEPGVVASEVAREAGIHSSQLFRWRQELCKRAPAPVAFNPVAIAPVPELAAPSFPAPSPEQAGTVEIEFATGGRMRITGSVDASTVSALIKALANTKGRR
jgi:transposase